MTVARLIFAGTPMRLDRYLRDHLGRGFGRRRVAALIESGSVRVNGRRAAKSVVLRPADEIALDDGALTATPLAPTPMPLTVLYRDAELVAVDKPPGVPSTAGRRGRSSVAGALLAAYPEMAAIDPLRAGGLVHRLDSGTSGVLVAARTPDAYRRMRAAFGAKRITKEYVAVVVGRLTTAGSIALPLTRRAHRARRMIVAGPGTGWRATTDYRPLACADDLTVVQLRMRTGVTHQLRVHLAHIGHPVLGDERYGHATAAPRRRDVPVTGAPVESWHYLHALRLRCDEPAVLPALTTGFPPHWAALFGMRGWPIDLPPPW